MSTAIEEAIVRTLRSDLTGIASAYLFGSVAEGREHRESDIDIAVLFRREVLPTSADRFEKRLSLIAALSAALERPVDLVSLNDAPPQFARRIVTEGKRLVRADEAVDHAFVRDVQLRAADLEPFLRRTRAIKLEGLRRR
jgi:predicted nucleotidyltransferase